MSLLAYTQTRETVCVWSDTVAWLADAPHHISSKAVPIPHLGIVVAGVGVHQVVSDWVRFVLRDCDASDMNDLALLAMHHLPVLQMQADLAAQESGRHTHIVHFGWSVRTGRYIADHFDNSNGFRTSRQTNDAFNINPAPLNMQFDALTSDERLLETFRALQQEQNALPADQRIQIGGAVTQIVMRKGLISINPTWGRLD